MSIYQIPIKALKNFFIEETGMDAMDGLFEASRYSLFVVAVWISCESKLLLGYGR